MVFGVILALLAVSVLVVRQMAAELVEYGLHVRREGPLAVEEVPPETGRENYPGLKRAYEWAMERDAGNAYYQEAYQWYIRQRPQAVEASSFDGLVLKGDLFLNPAARGTALLLPGWTDVKEYLFAETKLLFDCGMNVLVPDQRAHGTSQGEYTTFGARESKDAWTWLEKLRGMGYGNLMVMGRSMGAATAMLAACMDRDGVLKCAIEDAGFTSMEDEMTFFVRSRARWVPPLLYPLLTRFAMPMIQKRAGFAMDASAPVKALPRCKVPMLFIHGEADSFVPFAMQADLVAAHPGPKEHFSVPGAAHVNSLLKGSAVYTRRVSQFIDTYYQSRGGRKP